MPTKTMLYEVGMIFFILLFGFTGSCLPYKRTTSETITAFIEAVIYLGIF